MLSGILSRIVRALVVLALIATSAGMATSRNGDARLSDPDLRAWVLAGGSLADICADPGGGGADAVHCPECLIQTASELFAPAGQLVLGRYSAGMTGSVFVPRLWHPTRHYRVNAPRAPPAA